MSYATILYEVADQIAVITLNRPDRLNAISTELKEELADAFTTADRDAAVRVIILVGAGKAFCAGGDVKEFAKAFAQGLERPLSEKVAPSRDTLMRAIFGANKPVIAAINGPAMGAGMNIALAADIRLASTNALFSQAFVKRGAHPDHGGLYLLPRLVGPAKAAELILTGANITPEEALELGLVSQVVEPDMLLSAAKDLAQQIAQNAPIAVQLAKRGLRHCDGDDLEAALQYESWAQNICFDSEDAREGMLAFTEKRQPAFKGRRAGR